MKNLPLPILLLITMVSISSWMCVTTKQKLKTTFQVTGSIMQTVSYCGGAQPTQAMLDSFNTPKGIAFGKLFVKLGGMNKEEVKIIDSIVADANGNFSIYLPAGNYCLVEEWKSKPFILPLNNANQTVDSICYKKLYNTCDFELRIASKNINNVKVVFHRTCFFNKPCISYHGPLPLRPGHNNVKQILYVIDDENKKTIN